jgi:hypothetical protein
VSDPENFNLPKAHFEWQGPGNKVKQTGYHIMPVGTFVPHHPVTYFKYDGRGDNNYAQLDIQKGSKVDHADFEVWVFEGELNVDANTLYSALPSNKVAEMMFNTYAHEATRDVNASIQLGNYEIRHTTPGVVHTVALVAILKPGIATDDMVHVDSTALHIVSQTAPQAGLVHV